MSMDPEHAGDHHHTPGGARTAVVVPIVVTMALYVGALAMGFPQLGTQMVVDGEAAHAAAHDEHAALDGQAEHSASELETGEPAGVEQEAAEHAEGEGETQAAEQPHETEHLTPPPIWTVVPFVLLLGAIAIFPLVPAIEHWWESNVSRLIVAGGLGLLVLAYYGLVHNAPIEGHWPAHKIVAPNSGGFNLAEVSTVLENALLQEYIPFIVLLFSLYTISGGIRIQGDLQANPMTNAIFMLAGGVLASFIGTTGAAMLLIRPLLETNQERKHVAHTVVFFIFIVCNCGGCLLPIGDPPLFLGYLQGVPFFWTLGLWQEWAECVGMLLVAYLLIDEYFYSHETEADITRDIRHIRHLKYSGMALNVPLLLGVVLAVALLDPSKTVPGTQWHPWMYLREIAQLALVAVSLWFGSREVRIANNFNFHAIVEVAALFVGIFICMQPALQILKIEGASLGIESPMQFFWITGGLSSVLDNAPTYLVFFETARALPSVDGIHQIAGVDEHRLVAISLGAVFMGAMTYIGNGPNFMVKAIAEKSGVKMPSFFGYMLWSVAILLPIFGFLAWRHLL
ncbi:hypothetical protein Pla175_10260 [Pirellulimonas nuda]|uniref:Citrate transporter n=1 Tax=Pirellulimonas nuda TaxID=2528009 RepID=A0A518D879_9BACT|nr:sodium:proton antiporter [Pirellulimonas nuda]QDU87660.1 hypothetical protein Pla175_10260 [Pirellulimonas nuda]